MGICALQTSALTAPPSLILHVAPVTIQQCDGQAVLHSRPSCTPKVLTALGRCSLSWLVEPCPIGVQKRECDSGLLHARGDGTCLARSLHTKCEPILLKNEDAFLWQDPQGNFHLLMHGMQPYGPFGRHAYSYTGAAGSWTFSPTKAYDNKIQYQNGSVQMPSRRERPHLLFNGRADTTVHLSARQVGFGPRTERPHLHACAGYPDHIKVLLKASEGMARLVDSMISLSLIK